MYTTLYLTLVLIFGTRSTQDQVWAAGGKRVGIKTSHSRSLLTFKTQEIALKMKSVRMVQPDMMKKDGCHQNILLRSLLTFRNTRNCSKNEISWNDTTWCDESGWEIGSLAYGWGGAPGGVLNFSQLAPNLFGGSLFNKFIKTIRRKF